jgi:hypothetical protein
MFRYGEIHVFKKEDNPEVYQLAMDALDMERKEFTYRGVVFQIIERRGEYFKVQQVRQA